MEDAAAHDTCFGEGSVAGAVIGTFLTTILLLAVAALLYRQWRRHKGKHLVLVTDPEIVEDAYAFDNPCFKDATPAVSRVMEKPLPSTTILGDTPAKDCTRWSAPWTSLALGSVIRNDKRRTLDDSCLGPNATRVSVVSLRSHDFTGLGFNVCGNMREGIFVKDLLHRGPASESGRIHPGDRIASVKISFRNMVYEDALTILSYASPYDVVLEVESGGSGSKPTTLLKKSIGPSPTRICHPLYRSQSIPELAQGHRNIAKRLFIADPNESVGSNCSTINSTLKSSKSTPVNQSFEKRHEETKNNHHHKFGIKVLPALDGTVHRIENQNEHNTNLERRHSRKMDAERLLVNRSSVTSHETDSDKKICNERTQQHSSDQSFDSKVTVDVRMPDKAGKSSDTQKINIPSEVPAEVHNAAMAARKNRISISELSNAQRLSLSESEDTKSPQKNKRKAPAPPKNDAVSSTKKDTTDTIDSIANYAESLGDYVNKVRENTDSSDARRQRLANQPVMNKRNSESDTDSEMQISFTIELNPADITVHRTPVPEINDDEDEDDMYRKAASLGDLSKYENKTVATLERAQSLDMTTDNSAKKRKAPLPPDDINESTEDLTKLDQIDAFDRRKLKKSNEWGTLEDVIWNETTTEEDEKARKTRTRKKSNDTLERSKSAVEIKLKDETPTTTTTIDVPQKQLDESESECSIELYNLPLSKRLTQEFIHAERMFNPDVDNSLARIVNDGTTVKSPTIDEVELNFKLAEEKRSSSTEKDRNKEDAIENDRESSVSEKSEDFNRALRYFEIHTSASPTSSEAMKVNLTHTEDWKEEKPPAVNYASMYAGRQAVVEEPMSKVIIQRGCRACEGRCSEHSTGCEQSKIDKQHCAIKRSSLEDNSKTRESPSHAEENVEKETEQTSTSHLQVYASKAEPMRSQDISPKNKAEIIDIEGNNGNTFTTFKTKLEQQTDQQSDRSPIDPSFGMHFARRVSNISDDRSSRENDDEEEDRYEFGSAVTVNNKNLSSLKEDRRNISNINISSSENSEDNGVVKESVDLEERPPLPSTPMPNTQKMTYITEIKVSPSRENIRETDSGTEVLMTKASPENNDERRTIQQYDIKVTSNGKPTSGKKPPVPPRRSDTTKIPKDDKQVVYVSEYKPTAENGAQILDTHSPEVKQTENANKKFEHWIFLTDKEQNRWDSTTSQPQSVTNIMLSSRED